MITLDHVYKSYHTPDSARRVLHDVSVSFRSGVNVGILGMNGAGKSTLMRLLSGTELPDRGTVRRAGRVSFPLGFGGAIHPDVSGRENVIFIARVYGANTRYAVEFVQDFAELGSYYDMPTRTYSSGMLARLSFGISLAIDFDVYLVDEITAVGDARFQARCRLAFQERIRDTNVIMVSHSFDTIRSYCDIGAILNDGQIVMYNSVESAIGDYRQLLGLDSDTES
ncbi:capsular polysaccharide transport system ATP-binding protein [Enhydrobacter aerosaccus]|uniref:Capsular polysaccharide transport system ATP-binding protein n=1 Tax=Enhydrobacter aerosaccus TaxID=225324 RepID=A0A1T4SDD6_9HYPH|nr:ABC transporter ATP-binding protein [Enhydrobacter aerosaccus]SKA25861.1 capsular polysaccharide transport system ATP-binding protein [Enhydrobacter aerosaccus]